MMATFHLQDPLAKNIQSYAQHLRASAPGDVGLLTLCNVLNNAVTFITSAAIAALVSAEEFGVFSVAVNVTMMVFTVTEAGLSLSLVRHYSHEKNEEIRQDILRAGAVLRLAIAFALLMLAIPLGFALSLLLSPDHPISKELTISVMAAGALGLWASARSVQQATQNYKYYARLTLQYGLTRLIVVGLFYAAGMREAVLYLAALYLVSPLITAAGFYRTFNRRFHLNMSALWLPQIKSLFAYGKWVLASTFLSPLCYTLPLFLLMSLRGPEDAAPYGVGLMFGAIVAPLADALGIYIVPKVTAFSNPLEVRIYIRRVLRFFGPFLAGVAVTIALCSVAYAIVFSHKYPEGMLVAQILLGANLLASYGGFVNCVTHYFGTPHLNMLANLVKVVLCGGTAWLLIPEYGARGAAVAAAGAAVIGEIGLFVTMQYRLHRTLSI